ncbi:SDR family NAD(P)-dependent oxidoreductase [Pikeienuella piscinae]|uniref:SDR family NAD(P)-dependent oxidoreductase n=1 Tax=Pikeienuella piscinae TaxID=2748098 RepID=A0A7M3T5M6_9RHOB|nr:SDR family NAD(P)-dependent oxidoreductase [Pikeienuella piscinae]QIE57307.1 SDR family NAD(P)-dependent oxidoreductase [Pikeienuella piscinae]
MSRLAALTGGTGFLGRHAAAALAAQGWRLRMLARRMPDLPELAATPIELIPGRLSDPHALARLVEDAEVVIHMAGLVKARGEAEFMAANAEGTRALARAWRGHAPDARFVLVSSMAAREPALSAYAASKRAGEAELTALAADAAADWRILRPAAIYGAHDAESLKVLKLADAPVQVMLNGAAARVAMIDVRDAAEAIAAFAAHPGDGATYELTDARADGYSWPELTAAAAAALGRAPRPLRLPAPLLRLIGAFGAAAQLLTGSAEMLTPGKAREILHADWSGDPALAPPAAIWRPRIALADGLRDMAAWARAEDRL